MSTNSTLAYSHGNPDDKCPEFHLYEDLFDGDGSVHLKLVGGQFEVTSFNGRTEVSVKIPREIWNRIILIGERQREDFWET